MASTNEIIVRDVASAKQKAPKRFRNDDPICLSRDKQELNSDAGVEGVSGMGARLKAERKRLGFNQARLAEALNLSKTSLSLYERGERYLVGDALYKLDEIGADVYWLITGRTSVGDTPVIGSSAGQEIDTVLLSEVLDFIDRFSTEHQLTLTAAVKAQFAATFYKAFAGSGKIDEDMMSDLLGLLGLFEKPALED